MPALNISQGTIALRQTGLGPTRLAQSLSTDKGSCSRYLRGLAVPDADVRRAAFEAFGIPLESWLLAATNAAPPGDRPKIATPNAVTPAQRARVLLEFTGEAEARDAAAEFAAAGFDVVATIVLP